MPAMNPRRLPAGRRHPLLLTLTLGLLGMLSACTGLPAGTTAVTDFDIDRYLGTWYEIARLDHSFERGLTDVTATYSRRDDGGVHVVNRGFDTKANDWDEAVGKAYPTVAPDIGRFKVSFFGPFYGGYNILALDAEDYEYALVAGPNRSYLWLLARTPDLPEAEVQALVQQATALDFPTDELIFVTHERRSGDR